MTQMTARPADDAQKIIGADAEPMSNNGKADTTIGDVSVTLCGYTDAEADHMATLLVRASGTDAGRTNNDQAFTRSRPAGATDVGGYGDKAYYDAAQGQLSVLANGTYLIIDNGSGLDRSSFQVADAQRVADLVLPRLG